MSDVLGAVQWAMESGLSDVNTAVPGTVVQYDPASNRAVVRASMPKRLADGSELEAPSVHEVPVAFPAGGGFSLTFPLKPGDGVLLIFSQRSLEGWLSGGTQAPDDPRRFALSDAIAIPGLSATGVTVDAENATAAWEGGTLSLEPGGVARMKGSKLVVENDIEVQGKITATGDVISGVISLQQHKHLGVQTGPGITGLPTP